MTWSPNHFFMKVAKRWLVICNNNRFFYLFFGRGVEFYQNRWFDEWKEDISIMLYITLHYNHAHFKCSTLHFLQYLLVFLRKFTTFTTFTWTFSCWETECTKDVSFLMFDYVHRDQIKFTGHFQH